MAHVSTNQPYGTPAWVDLPVPDLERATGFYATLFGWTYRTAGRYTLCLVGDSVAAAFVAGETAPWNVYLATDDCDATVGHVLDAGGRLLAAPFDADGLGRVALTEDSVGARLGLWQGGGLPGCEIVNEPGSVVRTDLVTADPEAARLFYAAVFAFTLDRNEDLPDFDFTFLRRPDGHEVAGIFGVPEGPSAWSTTFEVADTDQVVAAAHAAGGSAGDSTDMIYGRIATVTDPFGIGFSVITRAQ